MKRFTLLAAFLGFVLSGCEKTAETTIDVSSIQCGSCVAKVENALQALDGVKSVKVTLAAKTASVSFMPSKLQLADLEKAIAAAGYDANDTPREPEAYAALDPCCKTPEDGGGH